VAISLASITRTVRNALPPRVVVHGPHGIGKSTLGASAFAPIFLPIEDGLQGLEVDSFPQLLTYADVIAALDSLAAGGHTFGTAVIDSLDWLERLTQDEACRRHGWADIEAPGYGKGYIEATAVMKGVLDRLDTLRDRGMAVLCLAHSEVKQFNDPNCEPYDRYQIKLQRGAAALVQEWADIIGFANFETVVTKDKGGFNKERARGVGTGRRLLQLTERASHVAKNRYGMPDTIPLSWPALVGAMTPPAAQAA
jgi:hypothetical protein